MTPREQFLHAASGSGVADTGKAVDGPYMSMAAAADIHAAALAASRPTEAGAGDRIADVVARFSCTYWDAGARHDLTQELLAALATQKPPEAMRDVLAEAVRGFEVVQAEAQTDTLRRWAERHAGKLRYAIRNLTGDGAGA